MLRFTGSTTIHSNRGITVGSNGATLDSNAGITGTINSAQNKTGHGLVVLAGNQAGFTGTTTMQQGTLQFDSPLTTAGGIIRVESSGTMQANASVTHPILSNGPGSTINVGASGITLGATNSSSWNWEA